MCGPVLPGHAWPGRPGLAWLGLAWPGLAWPGPGLAWPGVPGQACLGTLEQLVGSSGKAGGQLWEGWRAGGAEIAPPPWQEVSLSSKWYFDIARAQRNSLKMLKRHFATNSPPQRASAWYKS